MIKKMPAHNKFFAIMAADVNTQAPVLGKTSVNYSSTLHWIPPLKQLPNRYSPVKNWLIGKGMDS